MLGVLLFEKSFKKEKTGSIILFSRISLSLVACSSETKEPTIENQRNTVKKNRWWKEKRNSTGKSPFSK